MNATALFSFISFTLLVAFISWLRTKNEKRDTTTGLFLANRKNGFWVVGGSLFLSNISANQFIGENESVYLNNLSVIGWGVSSVFAMLIVSEFFLPIYLKGGMMTTPDFLEQRYDKQTKRLVSVIFLLGYILNLLPAVLYGGAVAFSAIFDAANYFHLSYWQSIWMLVWVIGSLGCGYSIIGGLRAITISDTVLAICMLLIGILMPIYGLRILGDGSWSVGVGKLFTQHKEHLNAIGSTRDAVPFATLFTGMLIMNLYYWGMEQYIVQQALAARSLKDSQKGIAVACFAKIFSILLINLPGLIAVHFYSGLENSAQVFPLLVRDIFPPVLTGLTASLVLGAAITTYNAGLNSSSTLFVLNLYKPWKLKKGHDPTEHLQLRVAKRFEIIISLTAMLIAPFIIFASSGFYAHIQKVAGMFSIPIFTLIFIGFITKRVPPIAAKIGLIFFVSCYALTEFALDIDLHFLHVLAILFLLTAGLMLIIGRLSPLEVPYQQREQAFVELSPWKGRYFVGALLLVIMFTIFVIFSPLGLAS